MAHRDPPRQAPAFADPLAEHVRECHANVDTAIQTYRACVRAVLEELSSILVGAAAAHAEVLRESGHLNGGADIREYRKGLQENVVALVESRLESLDAGGALSRAHAALFDDLEAVAERFDEEIAHPEPEPLYDHIPGERLYRRLRKKHIRTVRGARAVGMWAINPLRRLTGRPTRAFEPPAQMVPLRRLAAYHAVVRAPLALEPEHEAVSRFVGEISAGAARGITELCHAVLEQESAARDQGQSKTKEGSSRRSDQLARGTSSAEGAKSEPQDAADPPAPAESQNAAEPQDAAEPPEAEPPEAEPTAAEATAAEPPAGELLTSAAAFEKMLRDAAERAGRIDEPAGVEVAVPSEAFERDVFESGTFMLKLGERDPVKGGEVRRRAVLRDEQWAAWHRRVLGRVDLMNCLLTFRERTADIEQRLMASIHGDCITPARLALASVASELDRRSDEAAKQFERGATPDDVRRLLEETLAAVERDAIEPLREGRFGRTIRQLAEDVTADLSAAVQELPDSVEVNILDEEEPPRGSKQVELGEQATRVYDALLIEKIREEVDASATLLAAARETAEGIPGVLRFNLTAAIDNLERESGEEAPELVVTGLARSADTLGDAAKTLEERTVPLGGRVRQIFDGAFAQFHERLRVEERMREHILDFRTGAEAGFRRATSRAEEAGRRLSLATRRAYGAGRRTFSRLISVGRRAAGFEMGTEEERFETLDVLIDLDRLLEDLPLVYRRLFSFEPVQDPEMLEARAHDLDVVRRHVERWGRGLTNVLVVKGYPGSGRTSFLNVLQQTVLEDANVRRINLTTRVRTEEELVRIMCDTFELDPAAVTTLDAIAETLRSGEGHDASGSDEVISAPEAAGRLPVCFIEHLEHVFLRQIGGTDAAAHFLRFLSRTDAHMLWIATVSEYGWQILRTAEPASTATVVTHTLAGLRRADLETLILNRHRRSGLPIHFEPPTPNPNPLLTRRLRRARTEEERQALLRADFFDRLERVSGRQIMLALLYWLRSTRMEKERITVAPPERLSFDFLETLGLDESFTIKALLDHMSLTVDEHAELFLCPPSTSLDYFETLGNLLLIEPLDGGEGTSRFSFSTIEESKRYRVRPHLVHPIVEYLRSRNIVH